MDNAAKGSLYEVCMNRLFIVFLCMLPFQSSGLSTTPLRYVGLYLSNIPLMIIIIISFIHVLYEQKICIPKLYMIIWTFLYIICYSLMICLYVDNAFINSLYKTMTGCILLFLQLFAFMLVKSKLYIVKKYIYIAYYINILGWLLLDIMGVDLPDVIFCGAIDQRYHGFAFETSYFSFTTMILGILSSIYTNNRSLKVWYLLIAVFLVLFGGSKGTLACLLLAAIVYIITNDEIKIWKRLMLLLIIGILSITIVFFFLVNSLLLDISEATSVATRGSSIIASIMMLIDYPFGTGYGAFQYIFREYYLDAFDVFNSFIPMYSLSYKEIYATITDESGFGLSVKNVFFQYVAYFGIPFILISTYTLRMMAKKTKKLDVSWKISCMFVVICLLTYAQLFYDSIIFFAALIGEADSD